MIDITNITVRFRSGQSDVISLDSLSLHINKGEYVAILGPNGSGKSTLVRTLCGMIQPVDGEIRVFDRVLRPGKFGEDFFGDIGVVFQEPEGQFLMPTVKREIEAVLQNLGLPIELQRQRFEEIIELFQLNDILLKKPENLSGGQMQIVNLACALAIRPQILILDEPTTFLDLNYRDILISFLERFHKEGMTILHVTQFPDEAVNCDRIVILDKGKIIFDGDSQTAFRNEGFLRQHRLMKPQYQKPKRLLSSTDKFKDKESKLPISQMGFELNSSQTDPVIKMENAQYSYPKSNFILKIDRLDLFKGEIVGVVGPTGSGKSTLAYLLSGLFKSNEGQVYLNGKELSKYPIDELRRSIGITWQLPDLAMIGPTVIEDIEFGMNNLGVIREMPDDTQSALLAQVGLEGFEDRIVDTLSGGEKRKLAIAGILATKPSYIIMDEPAAFLDPVSQQELIKTIRRIAKDDRGILAISHDENFLFEIADRIIGLDNGMVKFDIPAKEFISGSAL